MPQPNPFVQCKGIKTMGSRMLTEDFGSNFTENMLDRVFKEETRPQFYMSNAVYEVGYLKEDEVFSFDVIRKNCNQPQNVFLEFSYLDYSTNTTKQVTTNPIFFRTSQCTVSVPIRIDNYSDPGKKYIKIFGCLTLIFCLELVLELLFLEDKKIRINIENEDMFQVKVLGETPNRNIDAPSAIFKAGVPYNNHYTFFLNSNK